jgi:hypothetical protein
VSALDFHVGPVFPARPQEPGHHLYLVEFAAGNPDPARFSAELDAELCRLNEDYAAHRGGDLSLLAPRVRAVRPGGFAAWMKARGKAGGANKVPRMDNSGQMTRDLVGWFDRGGWFA